MRTDKDAKAMAKSLRNSLATRNISLTHGECLEIVAHQWGFADWNTLLSKVDKEQRPAPSNELLPHPPPAATPCETFPDEEMPAIAIAGDLRSGPVYVVDWRPGVLSDPIELAGNGIYRIGMTPKQPRDGVRHWFICRSCGSRGSILGLVLANEKGEQLASVNLTTLAHCMGVAIFGQHGVMVQSVPRSLALRWRDLPSAFSGRNFSAAVINRV